MSIRLMKNYTRENALIWLCAIVYTAANTGRANLSVVISVIAQSEGIAKDALGMMASLFFLCYGVGQLLCGLLCQRFSPVILVGTGIILAGTANIVIAFSHSVLVMQLCWAVNGMGQTILWLPMIRILVERLPEKKYHNACLYLCFTNPCGMLVIYGASALLLHFASWRIVFIFSGALILFAALLWIILVPRVLKKPGIRNFQSSNTNGEDVMDTAPKKNKSFANLFTLSGLGFLIAASCFQGVLKDGIGTWLPAYITENFVINPSLSAALMVTYPIMGVAGVFLTPWVVQFYNNREIRGLIFCFLLVLAALILLLLLPETIWISLILFGCVTMVMTSINTLLVNLLPLQFAQSGRITLVMGLLNTFTYLSSGMAGYGFGYLIEAFGWDIIRILLCGVAFAATASCIAVKRKWEFFAQKSSV